jgi:hypothetical protein
MRGGPGLAFETWVRHPNQLLWLANTGKVLKEDTFPGEDRPGKSIRLLFAVLVCAQVLAEEGHDVVLDAVGYGAGVSAMINLK